MWYFCLMTPKIKCIPRLKRKLEKKWTSWRQSCFMYGDLCVRQMFQWGESSLTCKIPHLFCGSSEFRLFETWTKFVHVLPWMNVFTSFRLLLNMVTFRKCPQKSACYTNSGEYTLSPIHTHTHTHTHRLLGATFLFRFQPADGKHVTQHDRNVYSYSKETSS